MAHANRVLIFEAPIENVFKAITNYPSYPEFVDGVSEVKVISEDENGALVEFTLNMIKKFTYRLQMKHTKPTEVSWTLDSGDIFGVNEGYWKFKDLGDGRTEVEYDLELEIKIKMFGIGMIADKLTKVNLPAMLESYHKRARSL
jgi:coenzyme Q-binding protein COQ10